MNTHWQEYLNNFSRLGKKVAGLDRIKALLAELDDPQRELEFVHIAGTNGKGSICEMLSEIFIRSGYRTGLFTSPYIIEYNDRIRVGGENIPDERLEELLPLVRAAAEKSGYGYEFSQFEITMAAAFLYFKRCRCDVVVLETGLGGALDCTNVIDKNLCSVIGSVSYDHMAVLGDTLEQITEQKAGIIKEGCPCILSPCNDERVIRVFERTAREKDSQLIIPDIKAVKRLGNGTDNRFYFDGIPEYTGEYSPKMIGAHQIRNALAAIYACSTIGGGLSTGADSVREGIANAFIPGRTQIVSRSPLTIIDGGHNPDAGRALAEVLAAEGGGFTALIGMSADKSIAHYIRAVMPYIDKFLCTDDFSERALDKAGLAKIITECGGMAATADSFAAGLSEIKKAGKGLVCGSLFLAAEVLGRTARDARPVLPDGVIRGTARSSRTG